MQSFAPLHVQITSTGFYAPPKVETAEDLAPRLGKSVDWILSQPGVARRHIATEPVEHMAAQAARQALESSGGPPDVILYAATTPRQLIPDTSCFVQGELGLEGIACHTIHATCLSFLVGLHTASALIAARAYKKVLLVSAEIGSIARDYSEPESAALLGDGAAAAIVEPTPAGQSSRVMGYLVRAFPKAATYAEFRGAGVFRHPNDEKTRREDNMFHMNGTRLFRLGVVQMAALLDNLFTMAGVRSEDIDLVVPHQPSRPALDALGRWGLPPEKIVDILGEYGNCIAASMPMALATAHAQGRLARGKRVLFVGTGAGMSVGGAVVEW